MDGMIFQSTVSSKNSVTGNDIVGTLICEHLQPDNVTPYLSKIKRCLEKGSEFCTFKIKCHLFLAKMERISNNRIRITEFEITGMSICEVVSLFNLNGENK